MPSLSTVENSTGLVASIIIPIRIRSLNDEALYRLARLVITIPSIFEVIVVNDGSPKKVTETIRTIVSKHPNGRTITLHTRWRQFALSRSRNSGAQEAHSPVIIFHDVDFICTPSIYYRLANYLLTKSVSHHPENFFCVPVAFLTQQGSDSYLKDFSQEDNIEKWTFTASSQPPEGSLLHLVKGSSCIVVNRKHFLNMGGFDETYKGHGAEDFELLHRLSTCFPTFKKPVDYSINTGSGPIKEYRGFRAFFANYGTQAHQANICTVHLYHNKRKVFGYYKHRRNFAKLKRLMERE